MSTLEFQKISSPKGELSSESGTENYRIPTVTKENMELVWKSLHNAYATTTSCICVREGHSKKSKFLTTVEKAAVVFVLEVKENRAKICLRNQKIGWCTIFFDKAERFLLRLEKDQQKSRQLFDAQQADPLEVYEWEYAFYENFVSNYIGRTKKQNSKDYNISKCKSKLCKIEKSKTKYDNNKNKNKWKLSAKAYKMDLRQDIEDIANNKVYIWDVWCTPEEAEKYEKLKDTVEIIHAKTFRVEKIDEKLIKNLKILDKCDHPIMRDVSIEKILGTYLYHEHWARKPFRDMFRKVSDLWYKNCTSGIYDAFQESINYYNTHLIEVQRIKLRRILSDTVSIIYGKTTRGQKIDKELMKNLYVFDKCGDPKIKELKDVSMNEVLDSCFNYSHHGWTKRPFIKIFSKVTDLRKKNCTIGIHDAFQESLNHYNDFLESFKTCGICCDNPENLISVHHPWCFICKECLESYVKMMIGKKLKQCPCMNCDRPFTKNNLKSIAPPELYELYKTSLWQTKLIVCEDFRFCPNENCGVGFQMPKECCEVQNLTCPSCDYEFCSQCYGPNHSEIGTCKQFLSYNKGNDICTDFREVKQCPFCLVWIEKNYGCSHMTCNHCGNEFCWTCMGDYHHPVYSRFSSRNQQCHKKVNRPDLVELALNSIFSCRNDYCNRALRPYFLLNDRYYRSGAKCGKCKSSLKLGCVVVGCKSCRYNICLTCVTGSSKSSQFSMDLHTKAIKNSTFRVDEVSDVVKKMLGVGSDDILCILNRNAIVRQTEDLKSYQKYILNQGTIVDVKQIKGNRAEISFCKTGRSGWLSICTTKGLLLYPHDNQKQALKIFESQDAKTPFCTSDYSNFYEDCELTLEIFEEDLDFNLHTMVNSSRRAKSIAFKQKPKNKKQNSKRGNKNCDDQKVE